MTIDITRRAFLGVAGASALTLACDSSRTTRPAKSSESTLQSQEIILFQGDSITDASRVNTVDGFNEPAGLGQGYAFIVAAELLRDRVGDGPRIYNRGVAGNRVVDLAGRWQSDAIDLRPTIVSVLVGINDVVHDATAGRSSADYERDYTALLDATKASLGDVRLIVLEPFLLSMATVNADWFAVLDDYRAAAARVAQAVGGTFIPLYERLTRLAEQFSPSTWSVDGIHPTLAGHAEIAAAWRNQTEI